MSRIQRQDLKYWQSIEARFAALYPNGMTQQEIDEANAEMWKDCYPTWQMSQEDEQEQQDLLRP